MMRRREFLRVSGGCLLAARLAPPAAGAADSLYVLGPTDPGRLKVDFNSNKTKVRLVFMLSPT